MSDALIYMKDGQVIGPVSERRLRALVAAGEVVAGDLVWDEGGGRWVAVGQVKGLGEMAVGQVSREVLERAKGMGRPAIGNSDGQGAIGDENLGMGNVNGQIEGGGIGREGMVKVLAGCVVLLVVLLVGLLAWPSGAESKKDVGDGGGGEARIVAVGGGDGGGGSAKAAASKREFETRVKPLLKKYCYGCHGKAKAKGDFDMEKYATRMSVLRGRKQWKIVSQQLHSRDMPPRKKRVAQPTDAERKLMYRWIDETVDFLDCSGPKDPGRVTLHRLNREEYNNTIRDLVGIDFKAAKDFPQDDVGEGFDNNADVLSLSPLLLEKYLKAAETIVEDTLKKQGAAEKGTRRFASRDMGNTIRGKRGGRLDVEGEAYVHVDLAVSGKYLMRVRVFGEQCGNELPKMAIQVDKKVLKTVSVKELEYKPGEYAVEVRLAAGKRRLGAAYLNNYRNFKVKDPKKRDRNLIIEQIELVGPLDAKGPEGEAVYQKVLFVKPKDKAQAGAAARRVIERFARRAFRRPVSSLDVAKYHRLFTMRMKEGDEFEEAIKLPLIAILVSPDFLFRVERERGKSVKDGVYRLGQFELASRLSYFLWSSMPDERLYRVAASGRLHDEKALEGEVRRMLKDKKARAFVENFASQWLTLRRLETVTVDKKRFPGYDKSLKSAMHAEVISYFEGLIREDRSLLELIQSDYTYVNERLAKHYGIGGVKGAGMRKVKVEGGRRGGVLTMAGVLTVTSNPTRTNPVLRGKWMMEQILGTSPPPAPEGVPDFPEEGPKNKNMTLRERFELHRSDPGCASCHSKMDPLGFAMENFDAIGRWREKDAGKKVDASGVLPNGQKFSGVVELKGVLLSQKDKIVSSLVEKMLTYSLGRGIEYYDGCTIKEVGAAVAKDGYRMTRLIVEIAKSYPFRYQRTRQLDKERNDE